MKNMRFYLLIFVFSLGIIFGRGEIAAGAFYLPKDLTGDLAPLNLKEMEASTQRLTIGGQKCSSFFVSNQGHLLTNLHCVDICLFRQGVLGHFGQPGVRLDINQRLIEGRVNIPCPETHIASLDLHGAHILFIGRGFANFDDFEIERFSPESLKRLDEIFFGDFAVLQFDVSSLDLKRSACLSISTTPVVAEDRVWMASFPGSVYRPADHGSDGSSRLMSFGILGSSIRQNEFFKQYALPESFWNRQEFWSRQFLVSNLDSAFGSSGAPWLNHEGNVIALNAGIAGPNQKQNGERFYAYSSLALPISEILKSIQSESEPEFVSQVFRCEKNR